LIHNKKNYKSQKKKNIFKRKYQQSTVKIFQISAKALSHTHTCTAACISKTKKITHYQFCFLDSHFTEKRKLVVFNHLVAEEKWNYFFVIIVNWFFFLLL
jgi:hypothetical protein